MCKIIYLDLLQMVRPGRETLDLSFFDFYMFGSFDALKVSSHSMDKDGNGDIFTLPELHRIGKERRQEIPWQFDRQPMYLYTEEDAAEDIFRTDDSYAARPLVLTLIQLRDPDLTCNTPGDLIEAFRNRINACIDRDGIPTVEFKVFFCLGEPDLVVAFRHDRLQDIGRLVYRIRLLNPEETAGVNDGICVLSTSSHCAFPGGFPANLLSKHIGEWAGKEGGTRFLTLFDTSYGLDNNSKREDKGRNKGLFHKEMLLGDWDYVWNWESPDARDLLMKHILKPVTDFNVHRPGAFRSSLSLPVIGLTDEDLTYGPSGRKLSDLPETHLLEDYQGENTTFSVLANLILGFSDLYGGADRTRDLSNIVLSMQGTLNGILKHLYQLRDGRGQYDLYAFVKPAFTSLPKITRNVSDLLLKFREEYTRLPDEEKGNLRKIYIDSVSILLDTYIHDMSRLLTELQHLFSVLSISPHTYLESYGSNMRFVTASCKLLVAYQGIAYNLSSHYSMDLRKSRRRRVKAEEVMLVIPYRRILESTRVLFDCTCPENRIVYIRINSSDMLRVRKTLFLLLHECGHHILNYDFRKNRASYFFRTYAGYLLDRAFGSVYSDPLKAIQLLPLITGEELKNSKNPEKISSFSTESEHIRETIIRALCQNNKLSEEMEKFWKNKYKDQIYIKNFSEPVSLDNHFLTYVKDCACTFMSEGLESLEIVTREEGSGRKEQSSGDALVKSMTSILCKVIFAIFRRLAEKECENKLHDDKYDLWYLSELKTVYSMFTDEYRCDKEKVQGIIEWICRYYFLPEYSILADEVKIAFSDIYSDVFAFSILGYDKDKKNPDEMRAAAEVYLGILEEEAGFHINRELSKTHLIVRILALLEAFFGLSKEDIIVLIKNRHPLKEEAENLVRELMDQVGYRCLRDYTEHLCIPQIREQIEKNAALQKDMVQLEKMYYGAEDGLHAAEFMNAVYYFWKSSTQRKDRT